MKNSQKEMFFTLEEILKGNNYAPEQKALVIELVAKDSSLSLSDLCCAASIKPANEELLPILFPIYDERLSFCELNEEDLEKARAYLSFQQEELYKIFPGTASKFPREVTIESLVDFLSHTSDYLFQKIGDSLETIKHATMVARKDPKIQQSIYEKLINSTVDSIFKGAVSGVRDLSVQKAVEESLSRIALGTGGCILSDRLEAAGVSKASAGSSVKTAVKAFGKEAELKGIFAAAVGGALAPLLLPEYTSDLVRHTIIGGAEGYAKTGTVVGVIGFAVRRAVSRGIYYLVWKNSGKDQLKDMKLLLHAGGARIAAKEISEAAVDSYPLVAAAVVAGGVIFENLYGFVKKSENPLALSVIEGIEVGISSLKASAKSLWDISYEVGKDLNKVMLQMHGYEEEGNLAPQETTPYQGKNITSKRVAVRQQNIEPSDGNMTFQECIDNIKNSILERNTPSKVSPCRAFRNRGE